MMKLFRSATWLYPVFLAYLSPSFSLHIKIKNTAQSASKMATFRQAICFAFLKLFKKFANSSPILLTFQWNFFYRTAGCRGTSYSTESPHLYLALYATTTLFSSYIRGSFSRSPLLPNGVERRGMLYFVFPICFELAPPLCTSFTGVNCFRFFFLLFLAKANTKQRIVGPIRKGEET